MPGVAALGALGIARDARVEFRRLVPHEHCLLVWTQKVLSASRYIEDLLNQQNVADGRVSPTVIRIVDLAPEQATSSSRRLLVADILDRPDDEPFCDIRDASGLPRRHELDVGEELVPRQQLIERHWGLDGSPVLRGEARLAQPQGCHPDEEQKC